MLLSGRYEIQGTIFSSGIFSEYFCVDTLDPTAPQVIVQCVNLEEADSVDLARYQQHFNESGRRLKFLSADKSSLPKVFAYFFEGGHFYVVSHRVSGKTLNSLEADPLFLIQVWLQGVETVRQLDQLKIAGILVSDLDILIRSDEVLIRPYLHPRYAEYPSLFAFNLYSLSKLTQKALGTAAEQYRDIVADQQLIAIFQKILDDILAQEGNVPFEALDPLLQALATGIAKLSEAEEPPSPRPQPGPQSAGVSPSPQPTPGAQSTAVAPQPSTRQQQMRLMTLALGCVSGGIHGALIGFIFSVCDRRFYEQSRLTWLQDLWMQVSGGVPDDVLFGTLLGLGLGWFCGLALTLKLELPITAESMLYLSPLALRRRFWQGIKYATVFGLFDMGVLALLLGSGMLASVSLLNTMLGEPSSLEPWLWALNTSLLTLGWMAWVSLTAGVSRAVPETRVPYLYHLRATSFGVGAACAVLATAGMSPLAVRVVMALGVELDAENGAAVMVAALVIGCVSAGICACTPALQLPLPRHRPFWTKCLLPSALYAWGMTILGVLLLLMGSAVLALVAGVDLAMLLSADAIAAGIEPWLADLLLALMTGVVPAVISGLAARRALPRRVPSAVQAVASGEP